MSEFSYNPDMHPSHADEVIAFFGPESDLPFEDYQACAQVLRAGLEHAVEDARSDETDSPILIELAIQPYGDMRKLYGPEPAGTTALLAMAYRLTDAKEIIVDPDGTVVMHGQYDGQHVYFIEAPVMDQEGHLFKMWNMSSSVPNLPLGQREMTDHDKNIMRAEVQSELNGLRTVSEPQVVTDWIRHQNSLRQASRDIKD